MESISGWRDIMKMAAIAAKWAVPFLLVAALCGADTKGKTATLKGYVLDSACAFTKGLEKPISSKCAIACAKAGSPLVLLTADGTIYWPIADTTPSSGQNDKLLPFAGQKVTATGKVFKRGGSRRGDREDRSANRQQVTSIPTLTSQRTRGEDGAPRG
jgi:hypothetical protein